MRPTYLLVGLEGDVRPAIADVQPEGTSGKVVRMTRINVPQAARGKGYGSRLLAQVLADADNEGMYIILEPLATPAMVREGKPARLRTYGLSQRLLHAWYGRHGFMWYTPAGNPAGPARRDSALVQWFMVRPPAGYPPPIDIAALAGLPRLAGNYYQRQPSRA